MADDAGPDTAPRRGRPRAVETDAMILAATLELAGEVGINNMSMDVLAARAGVSKSTVYRRWPSKEQLVLEALGSAIRPLDSVDTGVLRSDLDLYLDELVERVRAGRMTDVLPHLIEVACHDDAIRSSLDDYVRHRQQPLRSIFQRAVVRGELPDDTDVDMLVEAIIGPLVYRQLLSNDAIDRTFVERLLATVVPDR